MLAAALIRPRGRTAQELARRDTVFLLPEVALRELRRNEGEFLERARCSARAWAQRCLGLEERFRRIPIRKALRFLQHPIVQRARAADPADEIVAASLVAARRDYLWTRDRALAEALPEVALLTLPREWPVSGRTARVMAARARPSAEGSALRGPKQQG